MNSVSDECTSNSLSHKKPSFSQNPTAQKLGVLDKAIRSLNLETYPFVPVLLALAHRKSPTMTMRTNHDTMTVKDCMEPTEGKKKNHPKQKPKPPNISCKKLTGDGNLNHIQNKINLIALQPSRLYFQLPSGTAFHCKNSTVLLESLMYNSTPKVPIPPAMEKSMNALP